MGIGKMKLGMRLVMLFEPGWNGNEITNIKLFGLSFIVEWECDYQHKLLGVESSFSW